MRNRSIYIGCRHCRGEGFVRSGGYQQTVSYKVCPACRPEATAEGGPLPTLGRPLPNSSDAVSSPVGLVKAKRFAR